MLHPSMPCPYPANDRAQGLRGFGIQGKEACCVPSVGGLAIVCHSGAGDIRVGLLLGGWATQTVDSSSERLGYSFKWLPSVLIERWD